MSTRGRKADLKAIEGGLDVETNQDAVDAVIAQLTGRTN